jgi:hypothetical protein
VRYKDVNEKLLHLSHLLSIGTPRDTYRQGMRQEEDHTLFNGAQSEVRQDVDTLNNRDKKLDFALCSSCGATPACDAIAVEENSAQSGGGQETVLSMRTTSSMNWGRETSPRPCTPRNERNFPTIHSLLHMAPIIQNDQSQQIERKLLTQTVRTDAQSHYLSQ